MGVIKLYNENDREYGRLKAFCEYMNSITPDRFEFKIQDTYFDCGADWKYTAIITHDHLNKRTMELDRDETWQTLNPREYETLLTIDESILKEVIEKIGDDVLNGKYSSLYEQVSKEVSVEIVVGSDDKIRFLPYKDYESIQEGVGGTFNPLTQTVIPPAVEGMSPILCTVYNNDEGLLINGGDLDKANGLATMMYNNIPPAPPECVGFVPEIINNEGVFPIYGNIVILPQITTEDGIDNIGFKATNVDGEICGEVRLVARTIENVLNSAFSKAMTEAIHEKYDENKPEPEISVVSWDMGEIDDFEKD
jgi:hypothetical protein